MKSRFMIMIGGLILLSIGWMFGWNYVSSKTETEIARVMDRVNQGDQSLTCDNQRVSGFPFRLVVSCDETLYTKGRDLNVQLTGFDGQAFVYRPSHQVVNFKSPARVRAGRLGTMEITWEKARVGSQIQSNGLSAATIRLQNANASLIDAPPELAGVALTANSVLISARRTAENEPPDSIVIGTLGSGLAVTGSQYTLPPLAVEASVLAYDVASVFDGEGKPFRLWVQKGGEADINGLSLVSGDAELFAKGWVKLDLDGFVNADLDVDSANLNSFIDALGPELAQIQAIGRVVVGAMEGLGSASTLNGKPAKRVKVSIRKGFVQIGFIPVGAIPQLDLSKL